MYTFLFKHYNTTVLSREKQSFGHTTFPSHIASTSEKLEFKSKSPDSSAKVIKTEDGRSQETGGLPVGVSLFLSCLFYQSRSRHGVSNTHIALRIVPTVL